MRPVVVVVYQVFEQLVGEVVEIVEGGALDEVLVEGAPEALDLAVGLWPIGPGVTVLDAELEQHGLEGVLLRVVSGGELGAVVGKHFLEDEPVSEVEVLIIFSVLNMTGSAFLELSTSAQARREQLSIRLMM
jgi:hypothetical protein